MFKRFLLPAGILLLAACGSGDADEAAVDGEDEGVVEETENVEAETEAAEDDTAEETADETISGEVMDAAGASADKVAFELVSEETFTNEIGQDAWEKYQEMTEEYELMDIAHQDSEGSSRSEIEEMMSDFGVEPDSLDLDDGLSLIIYHVPDDEMAHENGEPFIMADITYIFNENEMLMHSSIAPGFHEVGLSDATSAEALEGINTLTDLRETHEPQVFTIGEMKINEATITQTLIPVDAGDNTLGAYVYALGDDIVYSNGDLFFSLNTDFPSYSYLYYLDLIKSYGQDRM